MFARKRVHKLEAVILGRLPFIILTSCENIISPPSRVCPGHFKRDQTAFLLHLTFVESLNRSCWPRSEPTYHPAVIRTTPRTTGDPRLRMRRARGGREVRKRMTLLKRTMKSLLRRRSSLKTVSTCLCRRLHRMLVEADTAIRLTNEMGELVFLDLEILLHNS